MKSSMGQNSFDVNLKINKVKINCETGDLTRKIHFYMHMCYRLTVF